MPDTWGMANYQSFEPTKLRSRRQGALALFLAVLATSACSGQTAQSDAAEPVSAAVDPQPFEVEGGEPFERVTEKALAADADAPWIDHITWVGPAGPSMFNMFDLEVNTDYNEDSPEDTQMTIAICLAFEAAMVAPKDGVLVNGLEWPAPELQVDGSESEQGEPRSSKMAANNMGEEVNDCSKA